MRVLVSSVSRFTKPSGICRFASNLCSALAPHAEVTLVIGDWQETYFREDFGLDVAIRTIDIPNKSLARNRWYLTGLNDLLRETKADVFHAGYPIPLNRRRSPVPMVGTVHDMYPFDAPENFGFPNYLFNQAAFRRFVKNVDGLTCVSGETEKRFTALFPRESDRLKPVVVYNTVAPAATSEQPAGFAEGPFLLSVGQHRPNKNLDALIRAFVLIRDRLPERASLAIVGSEGATTETLQTLAAGQPVSFLNGLTEPQLRWMYDNALALAAPSLHEGFCLPPVEAKQYGCPSVVSDLPIFREIAPAEAVFVDPTKDRAIAEGLFEAINRPRPKAETPEPYRPESAARKYLELYGRLR